MIIYIQFKYPVVNASSSGFFMFVENAVKTKLFLLKISSPFTVLNIQTLRIKLKKKTKANPVTGLGGL
jgi:hypothetical protein